MMQDRAGYSNASLGDRALTSLPDSSYADRYIRKPTRCRFVDVENGKRCIKEFDHLGLHEQEES